PPDAPPEHRILPMALPAPDLSRAGELLPDVAHQPAALARPLEWVGMEGIAIPVRVPDGAGGHVQVAAQADLSVNLHRAGERGIHMSRLYLRLQQELARHEVTPAGLRHILQDSVESQAGLATRARRRLRYQALRRRGPGRPGPPRAPAPAPRGAAAAPRPAERQRRLEALPGGDRGAAGGWSPEAGARILPGVLQHLPVLGGAVAPGQCRAPACRL